MVAVGILRRPHRGHRGQGIDRGREGPLEEDALARETVDLRGGGPAVSVTAELPGARGVEDEEEDVGAGEGLAQRVAPR